MVLTRSLILRMNLTPKHYMNSMLECITLTTRKHEAPNSIPTNQITIQLRRGGEIKDESYFRQMETNVSKFGGSHKPGKRIYWSQERAIALTKDCLEFLAETAQFSMRALPLRFLGSPFRLPTCRGRRSDDRLQ